MKFWRMQPLLLAPSPTGRMPTLEFVNDLKKGGLMVVGEVMVVSGVDTEDATGNMATTAQLTGEDFYSWHRDRRSRWHSLMREAKIKAFAECTAVRFS